MIAIHKSDAGFHGNWKLYLIKKSIPFKIVNCYDNDLIDQLKGCDALMWHHSQNNPTDLIVAKEILFALQQTGIIVFPDFNSNWHFDDKLGQKYLFEALQLPTVKSYAFYNRVSALNFVKNAAYPLVFKLRGGAGSFNVRLVKNEKEAIKIVSKSFKNGFSNFNSIKHLKENFRKWRLNKSGIIELLKGFYRLIIKPDYAKILGNEVGYVYFQDFIPENTYDLRTIVIDNKVFAIKRNVRDNDFRASGSGDIEYEKSNFSEELIQLSLDLSKKLQTQCVAFDFVYKNSKPYLIEISYGFLKEGYLKCVGYWDVDLNFHDGVFDPCEWMVDLVVKSTHEK